jgi:hypothetical protein
LIENAIPSVNLPTKTFSQKTNENSCRGRKRQMLKEESDVTNYSISDFCEDERNAVDSLLNLRSETIWFAASKFTTERCFITFKLINEKTFI